MLFSRLNAVKLFELDKRCDDADQTCVLRISETPRRTRKMKMRFKLAGRYLLVHSKLADSSACLAISATDDWKL